jgi:hypothetical protein
MSRLPRLEKHDEDEPGGCESRNHSVEGKQLRRCAEPDPLQRHQPDRVETEDATTKLARRRKHERGIDIV